MFEKRLHVSNHPRNASQNNRAITVLEQWNVKACYHEVLVRTWAARYTAGGCSWNGHSTIRQAGRSHRTWMNTWDPAARRLHIHSMENLTWVRKDGPCSFTFEGGICSPKSSCRQDQIFREEILHFYQMIPERRKTMLPYLFCEARIGAVDQWF